MMRHQNRPKSQPPIKLNEVCSNYKRQQTHEQQATVNNDNENHWSKLSERYDRSRAQFKGSLGNLETLKELDTDPTTARSAECDQVKEDLILISSPSSSSSNSPTGSTLSLSSTASSASTVMAAGATGLPKESTASSVGSSTTSSDCEDDQNPSSSSSIASSSGVSSQTNCSVEAPSKGSRERVVAECLEELVESVALSAEQLVEDPLVLSTKAHMVKELEVEFVYEKSEFNDVQIVKMARRNIFNALKQAKELGEREPAWRVNIIRGNSKAADNKQQPFISWYQSTSGAISLARQSTEGADSAQSHRRQPTEVCVPADEIIGCLIEHELVIWLVERTPVDQVEMERAIRSNRERAGQEEVGDEGADYLPCADKLARRTDRRLVRRSRQGDLPVELAGGNLIGVETGDLHSIDAIVWLCASEHDASQVRDQWRQQIADWRPPSGGNSNDGAGGNVTSAPFERDLGELAIGSRLVHGLIRQPAGGRQELPSKSIRPTTTTVTAGAPNGCEPARAHYYSDDDLGEQMSDNSDEGGSVIEVDPPTSVMTIVDLECGQKMDSSLVARQRRPGSGAGGLKNCRNSIFVHSASRLRNLTDANNNNFKQLTVKSGSIRDLPQACRSRLAVKTSLKTAESLSQLTSLAGPLGQATAADHQRRSDSLEPLVVDKNDDAAGLSASGRRQSATVPVVKPRMSILKNKQQQQTFDNKITAPAHPVTKQPQEPTNRQAVVDNENVAARRADRKHLASDWRLSVSSIRLNSSGAGVASQETVAGGATGRTHKQKSILKNGSDERKLIGSTGTNELRSDKLSRRSSLAQPPASESGLAGVSAKLARSGSPAGDITRRRQQQVNQEQALRATNGAGKRQQIADAAPTEQSGESEKIRALRTSTCESGTNLAQQRRKSIANFDAPTGKRQLADEERNKIERVRAKTAASIKVCEQPRQPDTQLDDEEFVSSDSLARERAFERLRQRASCYDITRLMSRNDTIQSQLARLRSGDARQRKPAELKSYQDRLAPGSKRSADNKSSEASTAASDTKAKRISTITIEGAKCAPRATGDEDPDGTIKARGSSVRQLRHSLASVDWTKQPVADEHEDKSETKMKTNSSKAIEAKSGCVLAGGVAVLPLAIRKSREDFTKTNSEAERNSPEPPSDGSQSDDDTDRELQSTSDTRKQVIDSQDDREAEADGDKKDTEAQGSGAAAKNSGLSKFNLLRQSFNQKTISSMLKFSSRASMRIISSKTSAKIRSDAAQSGIEQDTDMPAKPARSGAKSQDGVKVQAVAKKQQQQQQQHQPSPKLKEQHKIEQQQEQQIAAIDQATLMLYKRHMQGQQLQQRQLMIQQQQQQQRQQQQFAFQWQQQMLIQQRHHQQSQQLAYMANHYQVTTAHHHNHLMQAQAHQQYLPPGHALTPAAIGPVPLGAGFAPAGLYAGLPQVAHLAPTHQRSMIPQQKLASKQSFASSAGTLLRKSIMKSTGKKQNQLAADQEQLHQSSHLIPLAVNHHSSVNIVYTDAASHYASSRRHEQQPQQLTQSASRASSLGASMRKTVKSMLVNSRANGASSLELNKESARMNEHQPTGQLKSALKQARSRESIVLNSEGSDGDGSSSTIESSSSADQENTNQRGQCAKPSILKKTSNFEKSSMLSLASDISTSSDETSFKRATSTRCSRRIPASALMTKTSKAAPQQRKNVTFSTKLTSIL